MVQHAFVVPNPEGEVPLRIEPYHLDMYRDDQNLIWKINVPDWGWSKAKATAIVIDAGWTGTTPAPIGPPPEDGVLDRRLYVATGPGPIIEGDPQTFVYTAYVTADKDGAEVNDVAIRGVDENNAAIDPDIGNQPQP